MSTPIATSTAPWIEVLRTACAGGQMTAVAKRIGYSAGVVSAVLNAKYKGNLESVQRAVEGALMQSEVDCPIVGLIPQQRCVEHQRRSQRDALINPAFVQLYQHCRSGRCPYSLHAVPEGDPK